MQRIARVLALVLLGLLAGCGGGQPVRVFPPELSVQELRTAGDGEWTVVLRLRNFSTVPMRFAAVRGQLRLGDEALAIDAAPNLSIAANSVDPFEVRFSPGAGLRARVAEVLAQRRSLRYAFDGTVASSEPQRRFEVRYESLLSPVPGLDGLLR
jgi:hypothetical protein